MLALGLFLAEKLWSGSIFFFINQRFVPLILFGAAAAIVLAAGAAWLWARRPTAHAHDHDHARTPAHFPFGTVVLVTLPLVLGLAIPARPLGASAVDNKGLNTSAPLSASGGGAATTLQIAPEERTILDWVRAFNYAPDASAFNDQPADVVGFVYRNNRLAENQFMIGRFIVTCCAADASAVALIAEWPEAAQLPENAWVRVRGPVRAAELDGQAIPLIAATHVEPVAQPEQPYMYP